MNTIIAEEWYKKQQQQTAVARFFKKFSVGKALKQCGFYKASGTKPVTLLTFLLQLAFSNLNLYRTQQMHPQAGLRKNTVYRFLNSTEYHWGRLLGMVADAVIAALLPLTNQSRENVLIVDDTLYERRRSKKLDMLSRVYDHVTNKYRKGFKLLTVMWSDGNTTIPLAYRHLASTNEKMVINALPSELNQRSRAYKLRKAAQQDPVTAMHELL